MDPPPAPTLTAPEDGATTNDPIAAVRGTAPANTTVTIFQNGTPAGGTVLPDQSGAFAITLPLEEGANAFTAAATNRAGQGPASNARTITLDTTVPDPPLNLQAAPREAGRIQLTWLPPTNRISFRAAMDWRRSARGASAVTFRAASAL